MRTPEHESMKLQRESTASILRCGSKLLDYEPCRRRNDQHHGISQASRLHVGIMSTEQRIVPGISVTSSGQATVDPALADVLFDLAIKLEEPTNLPVDVEHVLAALVLAARKGELDPNTPLSSGDPALIEVLVSHVKTVFEQFGGNVGRDE